MKKRRLLRRLAIAAILLAIVLRAVAPSAISYAARSWAEGQGLELAIENIDLALHRGRVHVQGVEVAREGRRAVRIDTVDLDVELGSLFGSTFVVRRAEVDGVDADLVRDVDGNLTVLAGLTLGAERADRERVESEDEYAPLDSLALPVAIMAARVQRVRVHWRDESVSPAVELDAELDVSVEELGLADREGRIELRLAAPGTVDRIALDAFVTARAERLDASANLVLAGVDGTQVAPYLAALGIEPPQRSQSLRLELSAGIDLVGPDRLEGVVRVAESIGHGNAAGTTWFELAAVELGFSPTASTGADAGTDVSVTARGAYVEVERDAQGRFVVAGFALGGATDGSAPSSDVAAPSPSRPAANSAPSAVVAARPSPWHFASVQVDTLRVVLLDRAVGAEPVRLELGVEAGDFRFARNGSGGGTATLAAPGVFDSATLSIERKAPVTDATFAIDGLTLERLTPYLAVVGLEPTGEVAAFGAKMHLDTGGDRIDVRVSELALTSGPATHLALAGATYSGSSSDVTAAVSGFVLRGRAEPDGSRTLGPIRLLPEGGRIEVSPEAPSTPIEVTIDGELARLELASGGAPAAFSLALRAPGLVDEAALTGSVATDGYDFDVDANVAVTGLRQAALGAIAPDPNERARSLGLAVEARRVLRDDGAADIYLALRDVDLDGELRLADLVAQGRLTSTAFEGTLVADELDAPAIDFAASRISTRIEAVQRGTGGAVRLLDVLLVKADQRVTAREIALDVPRADDEAIEVARVVVLGVTVEARRRADGTLVVAGFEFGAAEAASNEATAPAAAPATQAAAPSATSTVASRGPRLSLGEFVVEIERVGLVDEASGRETIASARLASRAPTVLFDPIGAEEPLALRLDAMVDPGLGAFGADLVVATDDGGLGLEVELEAGGLDDAGWIETWPQLAEVLVPGSVVDGRFAAHVSVRVDAPRTGPTSFDLARLSSAQIDLENVALVPRVDASPTLSIERLGARITSLGSATSPMRISDVEVMNTQVRIEQRADGLDLAGIVLRKAAPVEAAAATSNAEAAPAQAPAPATSPAPAAAATTPTGGGLLIDRIAWSGLDLDYADRSVEPPVLLPITEFDLDARHLALGTPARRAATFRATIAGGDVELPDVRADGAFFSNLARDLVGASERTSSKRPWLGELVVAGQVTPGAEPTGWIRTELFGFELTALSALAAKSGVIIGAGNADLNLRFDLRGAKGMRVRSRTTFTSLSIAEPADGPIQKFLRLPAPLDVVLFVLENERDEHVIPLEFTISEKGVSTAELVSTGTQALVKLIADALASSPLRIGGGVLGIGNDVLGMFGLDLFGGAEPAPTDVVLEVPFERGRTDLTQSGVDAVTEVLRALGKDKNLVLRVAHRYTTEDLERAAALAIPDPEDCRLLAARLELDREERARHLANSRERLARLVATGARDEAAALTEDLRLTTEQIANTETSLATLYELSLPLDERARTKRIREAALRLAERRFEALVRELYERGALAQIARLQLVRPRLDAVAEEGAGPALIFAARKR